MESLRSDLRVTGVLLTQEAKRGPAWDWHVGRWRDAKRDVHCTLKTALLHVIMNDFS